MTTETTCLSSIWRTDEDTRDYLAKHHREEDYRQLDPADVAYYDGCVYVDLSTVKPMIALPFHPSNTYEIDELKEKSDGYFGSGGKGAARISGGRASFTLLDKVQGKDLMVQQAVIAGCAGGNYTNVMEAAPGPSGKKLRLRRVLPGSLSFFSACICRSGKEGSCFGSDERGSHCPHRLLRPPALAQVIRPAIMV